MVERGSWTPGWYPDPMARAPFRWWDGSAWTDGLSDDMARSWPDPHWIASPATAPLPPPPGQPPLETEPGARPTSAWYAKRETRWMVAGAAVLLLLIAIASGGNDSDDSREVAATSDATPTTTHRPTTTERIVTTTHATTSTTTAPPTTTTAAPTTTAPPATTSPPTTAPPAPPTTIAAAPPAGGNCHPSYDPCVPFASDVDCLGGKGNGPEYTGRVTVIGPDVYDLDADGDGVGCDNS